MKMDTRAAVLPRRPAARNRSWRSLLLPALLAFAVLIALGTWQIERKAWKEALIASLTERLAVPPQALPPATAWAKLDRASDEYRRAKFTASFDNAREALVFAAPSAFRPDVSSPGYWVFTPARLIDGSMVVVNRGFVPDVRRDPRSRLQGQIAASQEKAAEHMEKATLYQGTIAAYGEMLERLEAGVHCLCSPEERDVIEAAAEEEEYDVIPTLEELMPGVTDVEVIPVGETSNED